MQGLSIKKNMLWNSSGSMVYLGCQWLITILAVRLSSDYSVAGTLALGMAVSNIFSPIGYYKIRVYQVSDLSGAYSPNDYIGFRLVTAAVALLVMVTYGSIACPQDQLLEIFLYGLFSFGPILVDVLHGIDQQHGRMDYIGKSLIARGFLSVFFFCVGIVLFESLAVSLLLMIIATFVAIAAYDIPATKRLVSSVKPLFCARKIRRLAISCFPLVVALTLGNTASSVSRQLLSFFYGTSSLGIYASVAAPVAIIQMGAQYIYSPLIGEFAKYYAAKQGDDFLRLLAKTLGAIFALTAVLTLFFSMLGEPLLVLLYGIGIANYTYLLTPLIVCTSITALVWLAGDLLVVMRKNRLYLLVHCACFIVTAITAGPLLNTYGLNGASYCLIAGFSAGLTFALAIIILTCKKSFYEAPGRDNE